MAMMSAHPGFAWCVSNCFAPPVLWRMMPLITDGAERQLLMDTRGAWGVGLQKVHNKSAEQCFSFFAGRNLELSHTFIVFVVIGGAEGGSIWRVHKSVNLRSIRPTVYPLYVSESDDPHLPVFYGFRSNLTARFAEFVHFFALCPPSIFDWLVLVDDNAALSPSSLRSLNDVIFDTHRFHPGAAVAGDADCCGERGIVINAFAMDKLADRIRSDSGVRFRSDFLNATGSRHPASRLLRFFADEVELKPHKTLTKAFLEKVFV